VRAGVNTVGPRVGYAFDRFLVYGTAGVALARTQVLVSDPVFGAVVDRQNPSGWVAGAGAQWGAWSVPGVDVTLRVEYLQTDFGSEQSFNPSIVVSNIEVVTQDTHLSADIVRAGVNLKFNSGGGAVAAKQ
jgi:opacity protein-like surface antigen